MLFEFRCTDRQIQVACPLKHNSFRDHGIQQFLFQQFPLVNRTLKGFRGEDPFLKTQALLVLLPINFFTIDRGHMRAAENVILAAREKQAD
jgi:hypothetical protein